MQLLSVEGSVNDVDIYLLSVGKKRSFSVFDSLRNQPELQLWGMDCLVHRPAGFGWSHSHPADNPHCARSRQGLWKESGLFKRILHEQYCNHKIIEQKSTIKKMILLFLKTFPFPKHP